MEDKGGVVAVRDIKEFLILNSFPNVVSLWSPLFRREPELFECKQAQHII